MRATNVKLSAAEIALACNQEVLLTKNRIIEKVYELFGELSENYSTQVKSYSIPSEILTASAKISRGENYLGLPWVVLDYPRYFKGEDFFSIRTFFWWGNYFSLAFLVKGKCLELINVENIIKLSTEKDWRITTINDPWQHHILSENVLPITDIETNAIKALVEKAGFLKLQIKIEIKDWNNVQTFMEESFNQFLEILNKVS